MSAAERLAGNMLEGAIFLKRGSQVTKNATLDDKGKLIKRPKPENEVKNG